MLTPPPISWWSSLNLGLFPGTGPGTQVTALTRTIAHRVALKAGLRLILTSGGKIIDRCQPLLPQVSEGEIMHLKRHMADTLDPIFVRKELNS